eukprot:TRINITY_DN57471_c0_g1_i1.p1 TRINITY_DN57471_c0_g1~~TRINITY_DN57471_c0_g1_i1.p1  ORF type:complete len:696 (+),score=106.66 TRINITY_DN57471_c0_g1_i1:104-2191(+)
MTTPSSEALLRPVQWTEEYSVNVPLIDEQHRVLFEMVDTLRIGVLEGHEKAAVGRVLKGLIDYCEEHFESEELVMQQIGYPELEQHAAIHQQFVDKCMRWAQEFADDQLDVSRVLEYLQRWLVNHILISDTKIAAYAQARKQSRSIELRAGNHFPARVQLPQPFTVCLFFAFLAAVGGFLAVALDPGMLGYLVGAACIVLVAFLLALVRRALGQLTADAMDLRIHLVRQKNDVALASRVAARIATMDLEMEDLLCNVAGETELLAALQSIVVNLRLFRPHIPPVLFALVTSGQEDELASQEQRRRLRDTHDSLVPGSIGSVHRKCSYKLQSRDSMQSGGDSEATPSIVSNFSPRAAAAATPHSLSIAPTPAPNPVSVNHPPLPRGPSGVVFSSLDESWGRRTARASIAQNRISLARSLKPRTVTCLTLEVKEFASLAETSTEGVIALHSELVAQLKECVESQKGMIHYLNGDHAICTWNACRTAADHTTLACLAAISIARGIGNINAAHNASLRLHQGLSDGRALVGILGCDSKSDFSVLSPVLATSAALCRLNEVLRTSVLIDSDVWNSASPNLRGEIVAAVEGRSEGSEACVKFIYELHDAHPQTENAGEWMYTLQQSELEDPLREYNQAFMDYCAGKWSTCLSHLQQFLREEPTHRRAQALLQRCASRSLTDCPRPTLCAYGWHDLHDFIWS